jgi:hypothetical protein
MSLTTASAFLAEHFYFIYHGLISIALLLACIAYKIGFKNKLFLILVLVATFMVEIVAAYLKYHHLKGIWAYHIFNLFEYSFFSLYYIKNCPVKKYKKLVAYSIPVFVFFGLLVSRFLYHFHSMPSLNINVEGFLLFIMYTHLLFSIDVDVRLPIYAHPDFWVVAGVYAFFGGAFVYINLYHYLLDLDHNGTLALYGPIMDPLNIIFYNCIIIGLICNIRNRKYLAL